MALNLAALEEAFAPLEKVGKGELIFKIGNVDVGIRGMTPEEEVEVHRYAQLAFETMDDDEEGDNSSTLDYLDRVKYATLGYSIIQIGGASFRDLEFVGTGDLIDAENPEDPPIAVRIPKHEAIRKLIRRKFSRYVLNGIFRKYGELSVQIAKDSEKLIEFEPTDIEGEIERLETQIEALKDEREKAAEHEPNFGDIVTQVANIEDARLEAHPEEADLPPDAAPTPEGPQRASEVPTRPAKPQVPPVDHRPPIIPQSAPPPAPKPAAQQPLSRGEPLPADFDQVTSSMVDLSEDGAGAAMQSEVDRFYAGRQAALQQEQQEQAQIVEQAPQGRIPPHVAAQMADSALDGSSLDQAQPAGTVNGQQAFRAQPVPLEKAQPPAPAANVAVPLNPQQGGTANPRFKAPRKG